MNKKAWFIVLATILPFQVMAGEVKDPVEQVHTEAVIKAIGTQTLSIDLVKGGIFLEGVKVSTPAKCVMQEDRAYVSLKTIVSTVYGGTLTYEASSGEVEGSIEGLCFNFKLGTKKGLKNDGVVMIENPLTLINGTIYISVKSLPQLFDMQMNYEASQKKILLTAPERYTPEIITSFADFEFDAPYYIQGQEVAAIDRSYDVEGKRITQKRWMLNEDKSKVSSQLNELFQEIEPGCYKVSLQVRNETGGYSEWTTKELTIIANEKPVVSEITSKKNTYAQGEQISLDYTYENEEWETIIDEKWTYKKVGEDEKSKVYLKPEYIFWEGEYEVGLQIQDAYGNWSEPYSWTMHISDKVKDTELNYKFTKNQPGTIIDNFQRKNYRDFKEVPLKPMGEEAGTYMLSDSPEIVTRNGILYEDCIVGKGRINFHHINEYTGDTKNKKLVVMAENITDKPVTITLLDKIIKGPSKDSLYVGQLLLYHYFRGNGHIDYTLKPGEKLLLINTEDKRWEKGLLLAGQMDMYTSGEIKFTVAAMDKGMTTKDITGLPYLETSIHPRGTFNTTELYYEVEATGDQETCFVIGAGKEEWCTGVDAIKGHTVVNAGNYGIVYHIKIIAQEDIGILLNPRGGSFRGAVKLDGLYTYMIPRTNYFGGDSTKAAVIATVKKGESIDIEYSLPNGSSAPVLFGMIPKKFWKEY